MHGLLGSALESARADVAGSRAPKRFEPTGRDVLHAAPALSRRAPTTLRPPRGWRQAAVCERSRPAHVRHDHRGARRAPAPAFTGDRRRTADRHRPSVGCAAGPRAPPARAGRSARRRTAAPVAGLTSQSSPGLTLTSDPVDRVDPGGSHGSTRSGHLLAGSPAYDRDLPTSRGSASSPGPAAASRSPTPATPRSCARSTFGSTKNVCAVVLVEDRLHRATRSRQAAVDRRLDRRGIAAPRRRRPATPRLSRCCRAGACTRRCVQDGRGLDVGVASAGLGGDPLVERDPAARRCRRSGWRARSTRAVRVARDARRDVRDCRRAVAAGQVERLVDRPAQVDVDAAFLAVSSASVVDVDEHRRAGRSRVGVECATDAASNAARLARASIRR